MDDKVSVDNNLLSFLQGVMEEELEEKIENFSFDTSLDGVGLTSLQRIRVMVVLEKHFKIEIDEQAAVEMKTIGDVVQYLSHRVGVL
jgi:acyl carrier protein